MNDWLPDWLADYVAEEVRRERVRLERDCRDALDPARVQL